MSRIRFFIFVLAVFLLLPLASAQERQAADVEVRKISRQGSTWGVKTFKVTPSQRPAAILAPNARVPDPPEPIDPSMMKDILASIGGEGGGIPSAGNVEAAPEPVLEHIVLTSRKPYYDEKGYLTLTLPYNYHPESAIVFNKNFPNIMGVKLKVEEGGLYLVDYAVNAIGAGVYKVETESGEQEFEDGNGKLEHVLVALSAEASGWTTVRMSRAGTGYRLYSVEVTKAN
jgi:hypothetical protein